MKNTGQYDGGGEQNDRQPANHRTNPGQVGPYKEAQPNNADEKRPNAGFSRGFTPIHTPKLSRGWRDDRLDSG
jgi:hypothetical protein